MFSELRRFLLRPSGRLARAVLVPVTLIYGLLAVYGGLLVIQAGNRLDSGRLASVVETLGRTWNPSQDPSTLTGLAAEEEWERVWIVSATGRIVSSSEIGETGAMLDGSFWDGMDADGQATLRRVDRAGGTWVQAAYHDLPRGLWAMVVVPDRSSAFPSWARLGGYLVFVGAVWLLLALAVATAVRRRLDRGLDTAEDVARRVLDGEPLPAPVLDRDRANAGEEGPAGLIVELSKRLQEQAVRYREAESRFASLLDLVPGAVWMATPEGRVLAAGAGFRAMVTDPTVPLVGNQVSSIPVRLPMSRIHAAARRARESGVTVNGLPVEGGDEPVRVSIAPVLFREGEAYLAHVVSEYDGFVRSEDPGLASLLVDASADAVVAFDAEARTVIWNRAAERISGRLRAEVPDLKRVAAALFAGRETAFMEWLDAQPGTEPLDVEHLASDGTRPTLRWTAVELAGKTGVYGGALVGRLLEPRRVTRKKEPAEGIENGRFRTPKTKPAPSQTRKSAPKKPAASAPAPTKGARPKSAPPGTPAKKSGRPKAAQAGGD